MAIGGREFILNYDDTPPSYKIEIEIASTNPKSKLKPIKIDAELDTGSDGTFISEEVVKSLKLKWTGKEWPLYGINDDAKPIMVKYYKAKIILTGVGEVFAEVGAVDFPALIGRDVIDNWYILLAPGKSKFEIVSRENYNLGGDPTTPIS